MTPNILASAAVKFLLDSTFVRNYADQNPPFGFNGLGELVYQRTYSRLLDSGSKERWHETVERVVNGVYSMQKRWILAHHLPWSEAKAQQSAQEMYDRIWNMKFLPPGRGLWAMGSPLTEERGLHAALFNCSFVSTENLAMDRSEPFAWLMDASMLGIGVGFDVRGAGTVQVLEPKVDSTQFYTIPDTREGWVESVRNLIDSYFNGTAQLVFEYSKIRPAGLPIKGFGGVSSGYEPLEALHDMLRAVLDKNVGERITVTTIVDVCNLIGKCVIAGNVRRTALLALGESTDEYLNLKDYAVNPHRESYGWTSNNSVEAVLGQSYTAHAEKIAINGEPGFLWLQNVQKFGRMGELQSDKATGANPCGEVQLESYELCNICETFPTRHDSLDDYKRTLKFAYLWAKTVTLSTTPWPQTNRVMLRNRRVGVSMSGIQQAVVRMGLETFRTWCEEGYKTLRYYDKVYSDWLAIPRSVRLSTVKPSGSVSLLSGATPGVHWPEARTYVRRMRLGANSDLLPALEAAGYPIEPAYGDPSTIVVEIPVRIDEDVRTADEVSMWEQLAMGAFMQRHWSDQMVSQTVTFDPDEAGDLDKALQYYQYQLKGISFLPRLKRGAYRQMPYEAITEAEYHARVAALRPLQFDSHEEAHAEVFCSNDTCEVAS